MPVKMNFSQRGGLQNHMGSIPIGHIKEVNKVMAEGSNQLVATAVLWNDEYPEEIKWLKDQHEAGDSPHISYEMAYADSVTENGTQWIKKLITLAATFVKTPAYGSRTSLLALASAGDISLTDLAKELLQLAKAEEKEKETITNKGGNNVTEQEIKELQEKLSRTEAEAQTFKTDAATKDQTISDLQTQVSEKDTKIQSLVDENAGMKKATLIDSRVRALADSGITLEADAEKAAKKKDFWASMSDEDFNEYVSDLMTAKKSSQSPNKIALASLQPSAGIPKPEVDDTVMTPAGAISLFKTIGRN